MMRRSSPNLGPIGSMLVPALAVLAVGGVAACGGEGDGDGAARDTAPAAARQGGGPSSPGSGAKAVIMELRQVQKELRAIRQRAMQQDSALQRRLEGLRTMIDSTIRTLGSQAGRRMDRLDSLQGEMQAARSRGDTAALQSLAREARQLQRQLRKTRSKAMEQQEVADALEAFRADVREKMREIAPRTDSLMDRADSLQKQMRNRMRGMGGGAGGDSAEAGGGPGG